MPTVRLNAKCDDRFNMTYENDKEVIKWHGEPPDFLNGPHGSGYVHLEIDVATGRILNWVTPTNEDLDIMRLHGTTTTK